MKTSAILTSSLLFLASSLLAAPTLNQCNEQLDEKDAAVTL